MCVVAAVVIFSVSVWKISMYFIYILCVHERVCVCVLRAFRLQKCSVSHKMRPLCSCYPLIVWPSKLATTVCFFSLIRMAWSFMRVLRSFFFSLFMCIFPLKSFESEDFFFALYGHYRLLNARSRHFTKIKFFGWI